MATKEKSFNSVGLRPELYVKLKYTHLISVRESYTFQLCHPTVDRYGNLKTNRHEGTLPVPKVSKVFVLRSLCHLSLRDSVTSLTSYSNPTHRPLIPLLLNYTIGPRTSWMTIPGLESDPCLLKESNLSSDLDTLCSQAWIFSVRPLDFHWLWCQFEKE